MAPLLCLPNCSFNFYLFIVIIDPPTKKKAFFLLPNNPKILNKIGVWSPMWLGLKNKEH